MNLDELRNLNLRNVGGWPALPKILLLTGIVVVILALGYFFDWKDQWETLETAQAEEGKLKV